MKLKKKDADRLEFEVDAVSKIANRPLSKNKKGRIEASIALMDEDLYLEVMGVMIQVNEPTLEKIEQLIEMFDEQIPNLPF